MGSDEQLFESKSLKSIISESIINFFVKPVEWFRENIVLPNQKEYYWYHEKLRRVPTIDECYQDDAICIYEANLQYKLDKMVDRNILKILSKRLEHCNLDNRPDREDCTELNDAFQRAFTNFFIKYGDLGMRNDAFSCYMKQKNRMAWERRHGPVGTGKRDNTEKIDFDF